MQKEEKQVVSKQKNQKGEKGYSEGFELVLVHESACWMLRKADELVDWLFINKMKFGMMTAEEVIEEARALACRNFVTDYVLSIQGDCRKETGGISHVDL